MLPFPSQRNFNYYSQQSFLKPPLPPRRICDHNSTYSQFPVGLIIKGVQGIYEVYKDKDLGSGTYGSVKLVIDRQKNQYFAMKIILKAKIAKFNAEENIKTEIQLQKSLNHQNIVKIIEVIEDNHYFFIILECCRKGNLFEMIVRQKKLTEEEAFSIFYQVCLGVKYLHENNIVHRDIKPENILICDDKSVKLCDFNWAIKLTGKQQADPVLCGTTDYMPPEVVRREKHDYSVDIWSLGIVLYQMLHGELPFKGKDQAEKINSILVYKLEISSKITAIALLFIHQLLSRNASQRPTIGQVFLNKWMIRSITATHYKNHCPNKVLYLEQSNISLNTSNHFSNVSQRTTAISQQRGTIDWINNASSPYKLNPQRDQKSLSQVKVVSAPAFKRNDYSPFQNSASSIIQRRNIQQRQTPQSFKKEFSKILI